MHKAESFKELIKSLFGGELRAELNMYPVQGGYDISVSARKPIDFHAGKNHDQIQKEITDYARQLLLSSGVGKSMIKDIEKLESKIETLERQKKELEQYKTFYVMYKGLK